MATQQQIRQSSTNHKPGKCDSSYVLYNSRILETANLIDLTHEFQNYALLTLSEMRPERQR